ncbi:transglutaminase-like putative cysteine protease [Oxalobacteraceae bacterium GrIS 1.11]
MTSSDIDLSAYLAASAVIDWREPAIVELARSLRGACAEDSARQCFEWVRDKIEHSIDFRRDELACTASDALALGTGLCIAKSHLLIALLRANGIAAGCCYQRLTLNGDQAPYCTHAYVAVWLEGRGWYRCDARGNSKPGIACQFTPGVENLAYPVRHAGECHFPGVWAEPWPALVATMLALGSMEQYCLAPIDVRPPERDEVAA